MSLSQKQESTVSAPTQPIKRAYEYFEDIKAEFAKISWTEGGEVFTYAKVVVVSTFFFGMLIYFTDLIVHRVLYGFDSLMKLIFG